jgi:hypothetical protein
MAACSVPKALCRIPPLRNRRKNPGHSVFAPIKFDTYAQKWPKYEGKWGGDGREDNCLISGRRLRYAAQIDRLRVVTSR